MSTPDRVASATSMDGPMSELLSVLVACDRSDLSDRVRAAGARLTRPATAVCVVGEFKQGKSSLVNGLIGVNACPVDDDLATSAVTLIRHGETADAVVRRKVDGAERAERIGIDELASWCSERGNPANAKGVQRVDVSVPSSMLQQGLMLVDTPGMGGLGAGHSAVTLAFLPFADGLLLVSDSSAELTAPEIELLAKARELCPTVMLVQTKIDLHPSWPKIFDRNRAHLASLGLDIAQVAVSSHLRAAALARKDRRLNELSRFPELVRAMSEQVVAPAKAAALGRSVNDLVSISTLVRAGLRREAEVLADPERGAAVASELEAANARLEHLRGPGSRWSTVLADRVADLSSAVNHDFRAAMRASQRDADEQAEALTTGPQWDELVRALQTRVADGVTAAFAAIEAARQTISDEIAELLASEDLALGGDHSPGSVMDVSALWRDKSIEPDSTRRSKMMAKQSLTGLKGAQSGMMLLGALGQFLPATGALLLASNPVLLGVGAVFGGMQLADDRKRKVSARRQAARSQIRQFIDDVQFEVADQIAVAVKELQRSLRDHFTVRLGELQRSCTEAAQRAQAAAKATHDEQRQRVAIIAQQTEALDRIVAAVGTGQ